MPGETWVNSTSRRGMLRSGCLALGAMALDDVFRLRSQASTSKPAKDTAVIFVTLGGGPAQHETYDPKPEAPAEYRGVFQPIATKVPGVQFCELLPLQAAMMDRLAIIRSVHHRQASHIAEHIVETGYDLKNPTNSIKGEMPSQGAAVSRLRGGNRSGLPGYVSLPRHHGYAGAHWLGAQYHHFAIDDDPNLPTFKVGNLSLTSELTVQRLADRRGLLQQLDQVQQARKQAADSVDAFSQQAFDLITNQAVQRAFDIASESTKLRDRYGRNTLGQRMLLARRLVEAGVPFVTVRMGDWDDHDKLAANLIRRAPMYDAAITALIDDLRDRELTRQVLVVAMGEFGRTPRINANAGRDHWPAVNNVLLAGGGFRMGQVIGATDQLGGSVVSAPYAPQNVLAMVYHHLGIEPATTFADYSGRPQVLLEERGLVSELL